MAEPCLSAVWAVRLEGTTAPEAARVLPVPDLAARSAPAGHEHLAARLRLVLRGRDRVVDAGESEVAGLELGGGAQYGWARR